ncbi:MAG: hypothetical protein EOM87_06140 [Clostridia bacterium]|nr:hypothetical protein [Clostridia bacterium]
MLNAKQNGMMAKGALFAATIIWGSSFFILKNALGDTPISFILALRFFIAFILLSIVFFQSYKHMTVSLFYKGVITGVILALAYIVQTLGLNLTTPGKNAFITASYCVMVPFMFWIVSKVKPNKFNVIAAVFCFAGIGLVSLKGDLSFGKGDALTLASGFLFAMYIVAVARYGRGNSIALFTILQFLTAGIVCAISFFIFEKFPSNMSAKSLISVVYLGIFATGGALLMQNYGQKYTNPSSASIILSFEAVFGITFSIIFYGERIVPQTTMGFILIFVAVIISETKLSFLLRHHTYIPDKTRNIDWLIDNPMTHRGVFDAEAPENSLKAFEKAVEKGYNIELDVQLTADGEIVVFHDTGLKRMCGKRRKISSLSIDNIKTYNLKNTAEKIPTLKEVLELVNGRVGLVIELKTIIKHKALCEKLAEVMQGYEGKFSVHSFSIHAMRWVGRNRPEWIHGIVSMNFGKIGLVGLFGMWLTNIPFFDQIKPDYIFYHCGHLDSTLIRQSKLRGMKVLCWTVKTGEQLAVASVIADNYLCEGSIIEYADKRKKSL